MVCDAEIIEKACLIHMKCQTNMLRAIELPNAWRMQFAASAAVTAAAATADDDDDESDNVESGTKTDCDSIEFCFPDISKSVDWKECCSFARDASRPNDLSRKSNSTKKTICNHCTIQAMNCLNTSIHFRMTEFVFEYRKPDEWDWRKNFT